MKLDRNMSYQYSEDFSQKKMSKKKKQNIQILFCIVKNKFNMKNQNCNKKIVMMKIMIGVLYL